MTPPIRPTARQAALLAIAEQAKRFPIMPPISPDLRGLDGRDARLAMAIHQATLQRYLTLRYILDRQLKKPLNTHVAPMRAALLTGAAQLLFLDQLPAHAVVDEAVELTKRLIPQGKAAGLVNAVLRKVAALRGEYAEDEEWSAGPDRLPHHRGTLKLTQPILPPLEDLDRHLSVALSHPVELISTLIEQFGQPTARSLLLHNLLGAPTVLYAPSDSGTTPPITPPSEDLAAPHESPGSYIWNADRSALLAYLGANPAAFVQDTASAEPVLATLALDPAPRLILDLCAGRGTKTRQLAALHPDARIIATDTDGGRFNELKSAMDVQPNVRVLEFERATLPPQLDADRPDLILLDVPCSNTGVLARRIEARYRYRAKVIDSLVDTQRQILERAASLLHPAGRILYATCSLDHRENRLQADDAAQRHGLRIIDDKLTLPSPHDAPATAYRDGSYYAVLSR